MKWLESPNSDEHRMTDESGADTGYRIFRDSRTGIYRGFNGIEYLASQLSLQKAKGICERIYQSRQGAK